MKKWLSPLLFLLVLFSTLALADSSSPTISSVAVSGKTDLSIAFLSSIFGTVSGVLYGTSGQMMGKLLYQFNQGLLVVAGVWLGFTVLTMAFKTALSGSFMQQDNKVALILLRVCFGFSLLIPNPSTGYTLLQGIVMQVVVQGVKLADQVWEYSLDYINSGGSLWKQPAQNSDNGFTSDSSGGLVSGSDSKAILGDKTLNPTDSKSMIQNDDLSLVQQVMSMEACMVQSSIDWEKNQDGSNDFNSTGPQLSVYENLNQSRYEFPNGYQAGSSTNVNCGSIAWNVLVKKTLDCPATTSGDAQEPADNTTCRFSQMALLEVINGLLPSVKKYVCTQDSANASASVCSGIDNTGDTTYLSDAMMGAMLNYINLIDPIVRQDVVDNSEKHDVLNFVDQAKKDGWMTAGRYYWDLLRIEGAYSDAGNKVYRNYLPSPAGINIPNTDVIGQSAQNSAGELLNATVCDSSQADRGSCNTGLIAQVNNDVAAATGASQAGVTGPSTTTKKNSLSWLMAILWPGISEITSLIMLFSTSGGSAISMGPEPILWLHNVGLICMSLGGTIWFGTAALLVPLMATLWICSSVNSAGAMAKSIIDWFQPALMAVGASFFVVGMLLGYYLPLYPYMMFTFGVIGWLIMVIEAMVAAPLVAMGITHPENHDFLGRSAQAVMLLLGVFLRPALMVVGLFSAMILCQVSLSILLYTFAGFANDIFYVHAPIGGAPGGDVLLQGAGKAMANVMAGGKGSWWMTLMMPLIVFPLFLIIFAMMVYTATTTCFSLIHHLPDYIMTWIGAPQSHGVSAKEMVGEVKGGISSVGHSISKGAQAHVADRKKKKENVGNAQDEA